jgi:hypothetical protein
MSQKPISPLRQRVIEDMSVRNFVEKTRNGYIRHVCTFTAFLGRSPDKAEPEDLRRFQLHQTQTGVRPPTINGSVAALRFFFTVTLGRADMARHLTFVREPRKIPTVLSEEEIVRLLEAAPGPKYKAALAAAYGAGLRVSEVVALKVSDIDSKRMLLRIEQGKGRKDRFAMLSPVLMQSLGKSGDQLAFGRTRAQAGKSDGPQLGRLLPPRRERPSRRAGERSNEFSSPDADCHVTLPWGSCNGWNRYITPSRAALRDFKPAYDCNGSLGWITASHHWQPLQPNQRTRGGRGRRVGCISSARFPPQAHSLIRQQALDVVDGARSQPPNDSRQEAASPRPGDLPVGLGLCHRALLAT